jgi:hypothetical protein
MNAKLHVETLEERVVPATIYLKWNDYKYPETSQVDTPLAAPSQPPQPGGRTVCNENVCYYAVTLDPAS